MPARVVLHSDINNFYAGVECLHRPSIRSRPVAVAGDPALRHGIVLAKNDLAKATGVTTGEPIWKAKQKCPELVLVPPNYPLYLRFARMARSIYADYTDQIEPFGLDEAWLDVGGSAGIKGSGERIAHEIRTRIREELGVTVSVGVSYNKIFAKLGSDMKKPDAVTVITRENFRDKAWPLPAKELLYVGWATQRKFCAYGINTIGDIAQASPAFLRSLLGKWGEVLWTFANGNDASPVLHAGEESAIKSIGNSTTTPRDLVCNEDIQAVFYVLCESVAARLRAQNLKGRTLQIHVRDCDLASFERQGAFLQPTFLACEMAPKAMEIFCSNYAWAKPVRSIGVRMTNLSFADTPSQLSLFGDEVKRRKEERLEAAVDALRRRFGHFCIGRAVLLKEGARFNINPKDDHTIHPVPFFKGSVGS